MRKRGGRRIEIEKKKASELLRKAAWVQWKESCIRGQKSQSLGAALPRALHEATGRPTSRGPSHPTNNVWIAGLDVYSFRYDLQSAHRVPGSEHCPRPASRGSHCTSSSPSCETWCLGALAAAVERQRGRPQLPQARKLGRGMNLSKSKVSGFQGDCLVADITALLSHLAALEVLGSGTSCKEQWPTDVCPGSLV